MIFLTLCSEIARHEIAGDFGNIACGAGKFT
jgi:hypothetical protein